MLPIRLELKNFLAYRNPDPLYLEGIHLACLSGANGSGKSSLLDAISWVIWGKARGRSDDDLIHIGQEEAVVSLDFMQHDTKYRIIRKRKLGSQRKSGSRSAGTTQLDFFGWVEDENTFRIINEPSIRQTQQRIIELIGLDYDTFINSAYLQQGRADSFTVQAPAHRKKILADILNLDQWAYYEDRAKSELREINNNLSAIDSRLRDMDKEIAEEPMIQREFDFAEEQLQIAREEVSKAEESVRELAGADVELSSTQTQLNGIKMQIREREQDIVSTQDQIVRLEERLAGYQVILDQRESIEEGYAALVEAREADQALGDQLRELRDVENLIHQLEQQISEARQAIERDITSSETLIDESRQQSEQTDFLQAEIDEVRSQIILFEQDEARREALLADISDFKEELATCTTENKSLKGEMDSIKQRLDLVSETLEAACPLCGQPLDEEHRQRIFEEFQDEGTQRGDRFRANVERIKVIKEEMAEREQAIRVLDKSIPQLAPLRSKMGSLEQQYNDAQSALLRGQEQQLLVEKLRFRIADGQYAEELQIQLQEAQQQREMLGYDENAHEAIRETLTTFKVYQDQANQLEIALNSIPDVEQSLEDARARETRWCEALEKSQQESEEIEAKLIELQARVEELQKREAHWNHQRTVERQALEKRTSLRQRLLAIEDMRRRYEELEARQHDLREEQSVYEQLKNAFSKNGIPAMVIEAAIPELEEEANRLLRRMTEGRMVLRFDTQREKKTGGVAETFDIWISDELGTRDYSMYSGGEAFRINFAIRVAISQLLARRVGAQLRTLFIDEGFGTQDDVGRERLVEAITAVQDEFDLLIVITHIEELRDAFPVRIEVEKLPEGSRIRVI